MLKFYLNFSSISLKERAKILMNFDEIWFAPFFQWNNVEISVKFNIISLIILAWEVTSST